jgi:hypothetical protein
MKIPRKRPEALAVYQCSGPKKFQIVVRSQLGVGIMRDRHWRNVVTKGITVRSLNTRARIIIRLAAKSVTAVTVATSGVNQSPLVAADLFRGLVFDRVLDGLHLGAATGLAGRKGKAAPKLPDFNGYDEQEAR